MKKISIIVAVALAALFLSVTDMSASNKGKVVELTKAEFLKLVYDIEKNTETLDYLGSKPAIVDFYAHWCRPCKQLAPIIEELSNEYEGRIAVGKCDIEEADDLTAEYGIRNVPTVIFIKNGQVVDKFVGSKSKGDVQAKFEALLG